LNPIAHESRYPRLLGVLLCTVAVSLLWGRGGVHAQDQQPAASIPVMIHIVADGETLDQIAVQYRVAAADLRAFNGLGDLAPVLPGQRLLIPGTANGRETAGISLIMTRFAETLDVVAGRSGVTAQRLAEFNRIVNPGALPAGVMLAVPGSDYQGPQVPLEPVRVRAEDSLASLALRYNLAPTGLLWLNQKIENPVLLPGMTLVVPAAASPSSVLDAPWESIVFSGLPFQPGYSVGARITTSVPGTVRAMFLDLDIPVNSTGTEHELIFGINRRVTPGIYPMSLVFDDGAGIISTLIQPVLIQDAGYETERVQLSPDIEQVLTDRDLVQGEINYVETTMRGYRPEKDWDGVFLRPSLGLLTSRFGSYRVYNNTDLNTFHSGTDFGVKAGTPVYAPAAGRVVDTGLLDIRGYIVILDHGRGVYTGYWHLASIAVNPGDTVAAGQLIGTVGSTGLSTASHIHWEMWVNGVNVDATQWLRQSFP